MKILQVCTTYFPELQFGGPPQKIHDLNRKLVQQGYRVCVATTHSEQPRARHILPVAQIEVQYLPWLGRGTWRVPYGWSRLSRVVQEADVVHGYGLYNLLVPLAAWMARQAGKPFVLEPLGMYRPRLRRQRAKRLYHSLFTERMIHYASRVIVTSTAEQSDLVDVVDAKRLVLRRNGIDVDSFRRLPDATVFRKLFKIAPTDRLVVFLGRISPIKNLETLLRAFQQVDFPHTRLVLIGPSLEADYDHRLRQLQDELGLSDLLLFTGPLYGEDKLAALAAADLVVLPSIYESYGNAAAEAIAAGVPVLVTEGCGIAPLIPPEIGLVVTANEEGLSAGLRAMLSSLINWRQTSAQRDHMLRTLSWEEPLRQMEKLYQEVVDI